MKLIIYNNQKKVVEVVENVINPLISENNVEWEGGSLTGVNLPFLLLEDEVSVEEVTDDVIAADKKGNHQKVDLAKENSDLKARQDLMQKALDDLILGGML